MVLSPPLLRVHTSLTPSVVGKKPMRMGSGRWGAYGLVPSNDMVRPPWWNNAPEGWLDWEVRWRPVDDAGAAAAPVGPGTMVISHRPNGFAVVERDRCRTTLYLSKPLSPDDLVHPYLGSTVAAVSYWEGWHTLHAAGVVVRDCVWGLLGDRGKGKSSTTAWLAANGHAVFADDLIVVKDGMVLAGPRALDLRRGAHERLEMGFDIGVVGTRQRWRQPLEPVEPTLPLGGWIVLEWGETVQMEELPVSERFRWLEPGLGLGSAPQAALSWLDVLTAPTFKLTRPRRWEALPNAIEEIYRVIDHERLTPKSRPQGDKDPGAVRARSGCAPSDQVSEDLSARPDPVT